MEPWPLLPVHQSKSLLGPTTSSMNVHVNHARPSVHVGKENVNAPPQSGVLLAKPKRKYVRKQQACKGVNTEVATNENVYSEVMGIGIFEAMATTSLPKRSRPNQQKQKLHVKSINVVASGTADVQNPPKNRRRGRAGDRGRGRGRRGHIDKASSSEDSTPTLLLDASEFQPPCLRTGSDLASRVQVLLRDLTWGGEVLHIPCPFVHGRIVGGEQLFDINEIVQVDLGADLEIQTLPCGVLQELPPHAASMEILVHSSDEEDLEMLEPRPICSTPCNCGLPPGWELLDNDSDHDWNPALYDIGNDPSDGLFGGASLCNERKDHPLALLGELGVYPVGTDEENPDLDLKYCETTWHTRTWSILPRKPFTGNTPGPSEDLPKSGVLQSIQYFLFFWDKVLLVRESNEYAEYVDAATRKQKGGNEVVTSITLEEFHQFTVGTARK